MIFSHFSGNSYDYFFYLNTLSSNKTLITSVLLDLTNLLSFITVNYDDFWYKTIFGNQELSTYYFNHPEIIFFSSEIKNFIFETSLTSFFTGLLTNELTENLLNPVFMIGQVVLTLYLIGLIVIYFFTFFGVSSTDESIIDHDYVINTILIESEEEIGSWDDIIVASIIFFFIFGFYFYFNVFFLLTWVPEVTLIIYLFPAIYYIIICIPTFLLYDFGLFFLAYLRGVGASSVILFELLFDYIAFMAFYIRLCVQGVRLVLMTFVYVSLHDLILLTPVNSKFFLGNDSIVDLLNNFSLTYESFSYLLLSKLPIKILYWLYELAHTFFVVTAQFIAFFAMVFWLFFFLYTFFVFEKFENYFSEKRANRAIKINQLLG